MRRREFLGLLGTAPLAHPSSVAIAQPARPLPTVGYIGVGPDTRLFSSFKQGLSDLGWQEGQNLRIEERRVATTALVPSAATELVQARVDVLFAISSVFVEAARQVTSTIPIVFATHADPVGTGHVASLARPGGNITGLSMLLTDIVGKELEVLKEALPGVRRVGVLWDPGTPSHGQALPAVQAAGKSLAVELVPAPARTVEELAVALRTIREAVAEAFLVIGATVNYVHRTLLAEAALGHGLPGMFPTRDNVVAGGLISYGANYSELVRRAATYVDNPERRCACRSSC